MGEAELLVSEITRSVFDYPVVQKLSCLFFLIIISHLSFEYLGIFCTKLASIKPQEFNNHIKQILSHYAQPMAFKILLDAISKVGCASTFEREREMFYLTTHSTHFIYGYMASDIWLRTIQIVRKETRCRHIGYSYRLTARVLLYAPSHRQDNTYHGLCYTIRGALAGTRNSSMGPPHEGSIRRPIAT